MPPGGWRVAVKVRVTELAVASGGTAPTRSNFIRARLRKLTAVEPEVRSAAPKLLVGLASNRVVSALGQLVTVRALQKLGNISEPVAMAKQIHDRRIAFTWWKSGWSSDEWVGESWPMVATLRAPELLPADKTAEAGRSDPRQPRCWPLPAQGYS